MRNQFVGAVMNVAVIDAPSSHPSDMGPPFRGGPARTRDDGCAEIPFSSSSAAAAQLGRAPVKEVVAV